jgi:hypothetical protein
MKNEKKNSFFELLLLNNPEELKNWLILNGKGNKPTAAISFTDKKKLDKGDDDNVKSQ